MIIVYLRTRTPRQILHTVCSSGLISSYPANPRQGAVGGVSKVGRRSDILIASSEVRDVRIYFTIPALFNMSAIQALKGDTAHQALSLVSLDYQPSRRDRRLTFCRKALEARNVAGALHA